MHNTNLIKNIFLWFIKQYVLNLMIIYVTQCLGKSHLVQLHHLLLHDLHEPMHCFIQNTVGLAYQIKKCNNKQIIFEVITEVLMTISTTSAF